MILYLLLLEEVFLYSDNPNQPLKSLSTLSLQLKHINKEINAVTVPAKLPLHCSLIKHVCLTAYGEAHITYGVMLSSKPLLRFLGESHGPQLYSLTQTDSITSNHYHNFPSHPPHLLSKPHFRQLRAISHA